MDEIISESFFEWIEENEDEDQVSVMFESCENKLLVFTVDEKMVKINFKDSSATSSTKDRTILSWVDFINTELSKKTVQNKEYFKNLFNKAFNHLNDLKAFSSEEDQNSSEENYHEQIIEAISDERARAVHKKGEVAEVASLSFYKTHFVYKEAQEALVLLEQTFKMSPQLKYSVNIYSNPAFCNVRLEIDLAFLEIPDSVMVMLGFNYESPLVISCSMSDIRLSQTLEETGWTTSLLGFLNFDILQAGFSESYGCSEYVLGRVKKFRELIYNKIVAQQNIGTFLYLSRESSEDTTKTAKKKIPEKFVKKIAGMGYPKKLVAKAIEKYGTDENAVIDYLDSLKQEDSELITNDIIESNNFFYNLLFYLRDRLQNCTNYCFICYKRHEVDSYRLRPCTAEICEFRFEEISGISVYAELCGNLELVRLDLSFAAESALSGRCQSIFEPFPSFLLKKNQERGKSGFLSGNYSSDMDNNKDIQTLKNLVMQMPNVSLLKTMCSDEVTCRDFISTGSPNGLEVYKLMRYIIATNRLNFIKLTGNHMIPKFSEDIEQYIVTNHPPETEKQFREKRDKHGSFFAFHGSSVENWYSILRNGIRNLSNTHMMTAGAAHGPGVYCAENIQTSFGYCRFGNNSQWPHSILNNPPRCCMAIIEVISYTKYKKNSTIYVVPDDRDLIIRYLLLFTSNSMNVNINAGNLELSKHYYNTQTEFLKRETDQRKERIQKVIKKAKEAEAQAAKKIVYEEVKISKVEEEKINKLENLFTGKGSSISNKRIMQEYKYLVKSKECKGLTVEFENETNLYVWIVKVDVSKYDISNDLKKDFAEYAKKYSRPGEIVFEMRFDSNYPYNPPFLRIIRPRFAFRTGHITVGGSICMQSITKSGWIPVRTVESVFIEILFNMGEGEARLDINGSAVDYQLMEAQEAFTRVARQHNWE